MPKISALPIATTIGTGDLFVLDQSLVTKSVNFNILQSAVANAGVVQNLIGAQTLSSGALGATISQAIQAQTLQVFPTIAALKASLILKGQAMTLGYFSGGGGGSGFYWWNSSDVSADNGGTVIAPNIGGVGRWNLLYNGNLNANQFGAGVGSGNHTAALQAAANIGGTIDCPGTYNLTGTVTASISGTNFNGAGDGTSVISFVPTSNIPAFSFANGATILSYCGIRNFRFTSVDTTFTKDMVRASDVSFFTMDGIVAIDTTWTGNSSVGLRLRGREYIRVRNCQLYADRPIVVEANPNLTTNMLDHSSVEATELVVSAGLTNPCIEFSGLAPISNFAAKRVAFVRGAGAIKCNLNAAIVSQVIEIDNCRTEQTAGSGQYSLDFSYAGGGSFQGITVRDFLFDPALNGIKLRNCNFTTLADVILISSTKTNLDVDGTVASLTLQNFFSQTGGAISGLSSVSGLMRVGYVIGAGITTSGFQRVIADAIPVPPQIVAGFTGLGSTGVATLDSSSTDFAGLITLSPVGGGGTGSGNVTMNFNSVYSGTPVVVASAGIGSAAWNDPPVIEVQSTNGSVLFRWTNGGSVPLTIGQSYKIHYIVVGK